MSSIRIHACVIGSTSSTDGYALIGQDEEKTSISPTCWSRMCTELTIHPTVAADIAAFTKVADIHNHPQQRGPARLSFGQTTIKAAQRCVVFMSLRLPVGCPRVRKRYSFRSAWPLFVSRRRKLSLIWEHYLKLISQHSYLIKGSVL